MIKQWIDRHLDGEAREPAMVHEIKELRAKLEELEAHTKTLTQAAYAARLERDVAWQRCKELEAQEPKAVNSTHTLEQEPAAWLNTLRSNGYQEADMRPASNTDMWINEPLYKRGTP